MKKLLQSSQRGVVVWFLLDFGNEFGVQHLVVFVEHHHAARGHPPQRPVGDIDAVFGMEIAVAESRQCDDIFQSLGAAVLRHAAFP